MRDLLIEVALDLLIEEGLALGTERLTFKRVFDRAATERGVRVTNASVIGRIWDDMADFQADVLAAALQNDDVDGQEATILAAARVIVDADLTSIEGRRAAAVEVIRVACEAHIDALTRIPQGRRQPGPPGPVGVAAADGRRVADRGPGAPGLRGVRHAVGLRLHADLRRASASGCAPVSPSGNCRCWPSR